MLIVVRAAWDPEADVWWTESSDLAGLNAEAPTLESLRDKLPAVISDLIEDNEPALRGTISWSRSSLTRRRASPPSHEGLR
jgi:hypothetical protein